MAVQIGVWWNLRRVLVSRSLKDIEQLVFVCLVFCYFFLLTIYASLNRCLYDLFAHLLIRFLLLLEFKFLSSLYSLAINHLSDPSWWRFSVSVPLFSMHFHLSLLVTLCFWIVRVLFRILPLPVYWVFSLWLPQQHWSFRFRIRAFYPFELIFARAEIKGSSFIQFCSMICWVHRQCPLPTLLLFFPGLFLVGFLHIATIIDIIRNTFWFSCFVF